MESDGSLLHSQVPITCPYPKPDQSSLCPHPASWRSILILSSHLCLGLPSGLFPTGLPIKTLYTPLLSPVCATSPPIHFSRFDPPNNIWWGVQIIKLLVMYFPPFPYYLVPLRPKYSSLFLNALSLSSSLNMNDQVSHPYKRTGKIIVLYIFF